MYNINVSLHYTLPYGNISGARRNQAKIRKALYTTASIPLADFITWFTNVSSATSGFACTFNTAITDSYPNQSLILNNFVTKINARLYNIVCGVIRLFGPFAKIGQDKTSKF